MIIYCDLRVLCYCVCLVILYKKFTVFFFIKKIITFLKLGIKKTL